MQSLNVLAVMSGFMYKWKIRITKLHTKPSENKAENHTEHGESESSETLMNKDLISKAMISQNDEE